MALEFPKYSFFDPYFVLLFGMDPHLTIHAIVCSDLTAPTF